MTESEFAAALARGDDIVFGAAEGDGARTLAGSWISGAVRGGRGIRLENAIVAGDVRLENVTVAVPVTFVRCRLDGFTARACTFAAPLEMFASRVGTIDVSGSRFERRFGLQETECEALDVSRARFEERFTAQRSSIGRLVNVRSRFRRDHPVSYYFSPQYVARAVKRRPRTAAVVASLVLHVLVSFFIALRHVQPAAESVATVQRLVFERKAVPTPRPVRRAPPQPRHVTVVRPAPHVRAPRPARPHALPRIAPAAPPRAAQRQPKEMSKIVPQAAPRPPHGLSDRRIAQIEDGLRSAIASDRGRIDPLAGTTSAIAAPKHFAVDATSFSEGDRHHHGLCDPIKDWIEGDYDYYYVICNVRFSDGTFQRQGVPWPVRFRKTDDPFNGTAAGEKPLAMPLPGWHLGPGETVTPELREYAHANGVDLDAAE